MKFFRFHRWLALIVILFNLFCIPFVLGVAHAQETDTAASTTDTSLSSGGEGLAIPTKGAVELSSAIPQAPITETIISMVNYVIGFLGFVATILIIYAGVLMVVSAGNEEAVTKGKKILTYSVIGFVIIILSFGIVSFVTRSVPTGGGRPCDISECGVCPGGQDCLFNTNTGTCGCASPSEITTCGGQQCSDLQTCIQNVCVNKSDIATSEPSTPASEENLNKIDAAMNGLEGNLDIRTLSEEDRKAIEDILKTGNTLQEKIDRLTERRDDPETPSRVLAVLDRLILGLESLITIQEELVNLKDVMPESKDTVKLYGELMDTFDKLSSAPTDNPLFKRFETKYKQLKDAIRKFPVVQARIRAIPGQGNVPFTTQLDGLDSSDPTGGTISAYQWSMLDASGNDVPLGSGAVIIQEFTEANTYSVKLRVSTSQKDTDGYKTAQDGISFIRIRANPPASRVQFRINGIEAADFSHVTLQEAQAGIAFDPSPTVPALGRVIQKYEWNFGDGGEEVRLAPTTVVHTYNKAGDYFVRLAVTDNIGIQDKRIVKLLVKSLASDVRISPSTGTVNTEFTMSGERSRSDDGFIKEFAWEIVDKEGRVITTNDQPSFTYKFPMPGKYQINLVITDITNTKDKVTQEITIESRVPTARFNFSIPQRNHPARAEFDATESYDPDEGDTLTYSWDFNGDGNFEVTKAKDPVTTYEYKRKGEFKALLQTEDSFGQRDREEKLVAIDSVLAADIVLDRKTARVGDEVEFSAENSNAVAYLWEFGDGETESTEKTTIKHTYTKEGKYMVKLNFFDKEDQENYDTQRLLVGSGEKPMAVIGYTISGREPSLIEDLCGKDKEGAVVTRADLIRFDARNSMNTDGSARLMAYDWRFPNGEKISTRETNYKFTDVSREGECFMVSLVVRDQVSGKISLEDKAYFKVINELPQITDFVITPPPNVETLVTPVKITLRAVTPRDPDGNIKKYRWYYTREGFENEKLGQHNTALPETEMVVTSVGEPDTVNRYTFTLVITDNDNQDYNTQERFGDVSSLEIKNGPNLSPVAEFTMDKSTVAVGDSISFISTSYDPQGDTMPNDAYRWDFNGDGVFDDTTTGPQINRQFNTPGEFEVRLKVIYRGLSSSAAHKVVVESTNAMPQAAFTYTIEGNTVHFDGTSSRFDPALKDPTLRFEWDFSTSDDANGNGVADDDAQATDMKPSFTYPEKGLYKTKLTVKDSLGMQGVVVREINLNETEADRQKNAYKSLKITAPKHPITTLEIEVVPSVLAKGGSADVTATILNADSSPYEGKVYYEVFEGSGIFSPNPVDAKNSKAASVFSATDEGTVRIRVRATDTLYGELTEEATINVR